MLSMPCRQVLFRAFLGDVSVRWAEVGHGSSLPLISRYHKFSFLEKNIPIMSPSDLTSAEATPAPLLMPGPSEPPTGHPDGPSLFIHGRPGMHGSSARLHRQRMICINPWHGQIGARARRKIAAILAVRRGRIFPTRRRGRGSHPGAAAHGAQRHDRPDHFGVSRPRLRAGGSSLSAPSLAMRVSIRSPSPRLWWMTTRRSGSIACRRRRAARASISPTVKSPENVG
jgi:hypothetical protein